MMLLSTANSRESSYLASFRPPPLVFRPSRGHSAALRPVWEPLHAGDLRTALTAGYTSLRNENLDVEDRAAITAALAAAQNLSGRPALAQVLAEESLLIKPAQWMAPRVLCEIHLSESDYRAAMKLAADLHVPVPTAVWDEPLALVDRHLLGSSCAWLCGNWQVAADFLSLAFPGGVATMPVPLQEDAFRLAFYRDLPEDAASAARVLLSSQTTEGADVILQMLVQQGWHRQALDLYRTIFDREPGSELLRRRLVGLCIREGAVLEARKLMEQGALRMAV